MKKILNISSRILLGLIGLLLLVYIFTAIYVAGNKKKVRDLVVAELKKNINGNISIGDVDLSLFRNFPKIGVAFKDVLITDSLYSQHGFPLLKAGVLDVRVSAYNLIRKKQALTGITLRDAAIILYTDSTGYSNKNIFIRKNKPPGNKSSNENELRSIHFKNVQLTIDDRKRRKLHRFSVDNLDVDLDSENGENIFRTAANIKVGQLGFNLRKGPYLKDVNLKGDFTLREKNNHLLFDSIHIKLDNHPFNLSGDFDLSNNSPQFFLRIHTRDAVYEKVKSFLPAKLARSLSIVTLDKPLDASASVSGPLKGGDPLLYVQWATRNTAMTTPFFDFEEASFSGSFTNEVVKGLERNDSNSRITASNFTAKWHGLPVKISALEIFNLDNPLLKTEVRSAFSLTELNDIIQSDVLNLQSGAADIVLQYNGPLSRSENTNSLLDGYINFNDGKIMYAPRNVLMSNVKGRIRFLQSDLFVENIQCNVLNTMVQMSGTGKQLLTLINTQPNAAIIDWNIFSPSVNLNSFLFLLKQKEKTKKTGRKSKKSFAGLEGKIDKLLEEGSLHVKLKANSIHYKKFTAGNLVADISMLQDRYIFNNVAMNHSGGSISMNGSLVQNGRNYNTAALNATFHNVDVAQVFTAFENFGQTGIEAANLEGKLTAAINSKMHITDGGKALPETMESEIEFSLKNGALKNFEPIKKIQDYIFKKRDFDNIRFAELKDKLVIRNRDITINRMEIQSSVLSLFVEGVYSMKGNTDISIQVPLKNLKKRKDDYKPENIGTDAKTGSSIFLRGRPGKDGNIKFSLDLFNKFQKQKKQQQKSAGGK